MNNRITDSITYIGADDKDLDLFEGQFIVPNGMAYNSYLITDDKIAVMDTADARVKDIWFENLAQALGDRTPDYLVVSHMEPDHASLICKFTEKYPDAVIVSNAKSFTLITQFFGYEIDADHKLVIKEGDTLSLGNHTLTFYGAPMVHWPEVMITYDDVDKVLFTADAFGKFGTLDTNEDWACEARRYYFNIVGKYGVQVQALLKKAAALDIAKICPLHGPILSENLDYYVNLYDTWSSYRPENEGILVAYASAHGNTAGAAETFAQMLTENGCPKVAVADLNRDDLAEALEDAFRYDTMVLAGITYNNDLLTQMKTFINMLDAKAYQKRRVAFIENGSWAPTAAKNMRAAFEGMKDIELVDTVVTIKSAMSEENRSQLEALAKELCEKY